MIRLANSCNLGTRANVEVDDMSKSKPG